MKHNPDYSKCVLYKICCKDPSITNLYVGHTTNISSRKNNHSRNCNDETSKKHNLNVYKCIRENGGWDNWELIKIEELICNCKEDALKRERYWMEKLGATLNKNIPTRTQREYRLEYVKTHQEQINKQRQKRYEQNRNEILEKKRNDWKTKKLERTSEQIEKYKEYQKQYRIRVLGQKKL
jgi:hypothetical protein